MLHLSLEFRNEIRNAIRASRWSDGHRRRVYRWLAMLPDGPQPACSECLEAEQEASHECLETIIADLGLEAEADSSFFKSVLDASEVPDVGQTGYLRVRGPHWVDVLSSRNLHVRGGSEYKFIAASPLVRSPYAYTDPKARVAVLSSRLFDAGLDVVDLYLAHMLLHGTNCKDGHGPDFKKRLNAVYPWDKPGPVTEHDSGTSRKELFLKARKHVMPL